jgi:putative sterol carrier protein
MIPVTIGCGNTGITPTEIVKLTVQEIFRKVASGIKKFPDEVNQIRAVYLFKISGDNGGTFHVDLKDTPGVSFEEKPADCTLEIRDRDFLKLYKGTLSGFKAVLNGKLTVRGKIVLANRLNEVFRIVRREHPTS